MVKNRWLTLLRNETAGGFLLHLPWILARDAVTSVREGPRSFACEDAPSPARVMVCRDAQLGALDTE